MQDGTSGGFFFNYCNNVLAHNATIYYDFTQNPWYQATITDISPNGQVWNITVSHVPLCSARHMRALASRRHSATGLPFAAAHGK